MNRFDYMGNCANAAAKPARRENFQKKSTGLRRKVESTTSTTTECSVVVAQDRSDMSSVVGKRQEEENKGRVISMSPQMKAELLQCFDDDSCGLTSLDEATCEAATPEKNSREQTCFRRPASFNSSDCDLGPGNPFAYKTNSPFYDHFDDDVPSFRPELIFNLGSEDSFDQYGSFSGIELNFRNPFDCCKMTVFPEDDEFPFNDDFETELPYIQNPAAMDARVKGTLRIIDEYETEGESDDEDEDETVSLDTQSLGTNDTVSQLDGTLQRKTNLRRRRRRRKRSSAFLADGIDTEDDDDDDDYTDATSFDSLSWDNMIADSTTGDTPPMSPLNAPLDIEALTIQNISSPPGTCSLTASLCKF